MKRFLFYVITLLLAFSQQVSAADNSRATARPGTSAAKKNQTTADSSRPTASLRAFITQKNLALIAEPGPFGKSCAAILGSDLIYDQYQKLSSRYRVEQHYNWACHSEFKSAGEMKDAGAKLGIPMEGLPTPLSLEAVYSSSNFEQSLTQWCSTAYMYLADSANFSEYSRVVDKGMVSAYKTCIDSEKETLLKKFGVFAYVTPQDDFLRTFVVNMEFRPSYFGSQPPQIVSVEGSNISCTRNGAPFRTPFVVNTATLALTCNKSVDDSRIIAFNTEPTGATTPVKLPGLSEGIILDIDQRTKGLSQSIIAARNDQKKINDRFAKIKFTTVCVAVENCGGPPGPCPANFQDTGFTESDTRGGGQCGTGHVCRVCYGVDP